MPTVTLSIKHVPLDLARRLKARAAANHRSLQGELLAILTEASQVTSVGELQAIVERLKLRTPPEAAAMIRDDRDGHRR